MKKTALLIGILCFSILSLLAKGSNPEKSTVTGKIITVSFNRSLNSQVDVVLKDLYGYRLLEESFAINEAIGRKYNLKNLPSGRYILEIYEGFKVTKQSIIVDSNSAMISDEDITYKPVCSQKDNLWNVNLLLLNKDADISIYDSESHLIYKEDFSESKNIAKSYNLANLQTGRYVAVFNIGGELFTEVVHVK